MEAAQIKVVGNSSSELTDLDSKAKYLTFWTEKQLFGISISNVIQIVGIQKITQIPEYPDYAKGIINLRGTIIPVMDMRLRFLREEIPYTERTCIIVTKIQEKLVGLIVDEVDEVAEIGEKDISQAPRIQDDSTNDYLFGIAKLNEKVILLLNVEQILDNPEISQIA